jgi:hypothetical protein
MIRKKYILTGVIVFTAALVSVLVYVFTPRGRPVEIRDTDALFSAVREGDIICRLGDRLWSQIFKDISINDRRYSHLGIIRISAVDGGVTVIHSEGTTEPGKDHVKEEPLEDFLKIARSVGIYRANDADGNEISLIAAEYLGLPFDWQFDIHDESELYCTELLYVVLKRIKPELELPVVFVKELGKDIIPLEAVSNSRYFSEIYYTTAR